MSPFSEAAGEISPDGRWLAYRSNESGRNEIYVRPFPDMAGGRWQVSIAGAATSRWSRNGQELFYVNSGKMMAVSVMGEPSFAASRPTTLFEGPSTDNFDVSVDGQRFLMIKDSVLGGNR